MEQKTVLISGVAGFLGTHLAQSFLEEGSEVWGCDNFLTGQRENVLRLRASGMFHFFEADVCEATSWEDQIPHLDFVFHFASPASPPHYQRLMKETLWVNSVGLERMLQLADQKGARCIFASTSEIYGDPMLHPQREDYWGNVNSFGMRSCYDEAKRFGEALLYSHNHLHKTKHGLVRIFNTYGPWMNPEDGRVVINFLMQARRGVPLSVYGDGSQTRSFCYVTDLIRGIRAYAASDFSEPVNLGNDKEFTILEAAEMVRDLFGKDLSIQFFDFPKDDPRQRRPNLERAREWLGWEPRVTLREGLKKMMDSLQLLDQPEVSP
jgi:nucleoside-diphosphate-sugar epimerase